ncbi:MAG TPA: Calx-beta domain-containing protein [Pyrinomonadaceae bacterium]|nr:Calx-beta domain-containing protein [Pyrinomonadaceae bacterium]
MRTSHLHILLAVGLLLLPLGNKTQEAAHADQGLKREASALCVGRMRIGATALMSFAGYRRRSLGLPWEEISTPGFSNAYKNSPPLILGLPAENAASPIRGPLAAQIINVDVTNNSFLPATVNITAGDTVRWTWQGSLHSVTGGTCDQDCVPDNRFCSPGDSGCDSSPPSNTGFIYSHQFNTAGTYPYFCNVHLGLMTGTVIVAGSTAPTIQLSAASYSIGEGSGAASITVSRAGATTGAATVDYSTNDTAGLNNCDTVNGVASARCDYTKLVGTVRFAAGETAKAVTIPIIDDSYAEGNESFTISLSNASGASVGSPSTATVTINDNEASNGPNPIDGTAFFVRQQYLDFLNREPDPGGNAAWQALINGCVSGDTTCDRIHVSSAFFRSPEFQDRGYFIYRFYPVAFGRKPAFAEFTPDLAKVSGFLTDAELEAAKVAFIDEFMSRPAFITKFGGLSDTAYVDLLLSTAQVTSPNRDFWIAALGNGTRTRATVLRDISQSPEVYNKYFNQAFVVMQYFGYLRREPDAFYLDWIAVLDANPNDFRGMVNGFMNSLEYRFRFGP